MNVVVLFPALASFLTPAVADGALCFEGTCLLGWAWSILALALASAWVVQRWQMGRINGGHAAAQFVPAAPAVAIVSPSRTAVDRSHGADLVAVGLALRAPPTTDMAAAPRDPRASRRRASSPPLPVAHPTGTPPASPPPGQTPPV